ncbi:uncharacterized protein LOC142160580 isoform X3 [Mixophyes fleayi]|uniref:uncharacterized protein LOC142160580 isoform X3 n=1 Tax=Mixophyes fleayi TaxID=3061075 RepID=UPI003F4DD040
MDLPNIPSFGPFPVTQQHRNILPVVPYAGQEFYKIFLRGQPKVLGYLISGVLSVSAEIKPSLIRVKGSMAFSIISCLASFIEFCLICYDFAHHYYSSDNWYIYPAIDISYAFLFLATVVQLSISVSLSIFGWKSLNQNFDYVPQMCVINNEYRYVMSSGSSQPTSENWNFIPGKTSGIQTS